MTDLPRGSLSGQAHILIIVATAIIALFIFRLVRARQLRSKYALLWLVIGLLLLPLAAVPGVLNTISERLGVFYSPAIFLLFAVGFLFLVVVHYSWELSRLENRTSALAEELALLRARLDNRASAGSVAPDNDSRGTAAVDAPATEGTAGSSVAGTGLGARFVSRGPRARRSRRRRARGTTRS